MRPNHTQAIASLLGKKNEIIAVKTVQFRKTTISGFISMDIQGSEQHESE